VILSIPYDYEHVEYMRLSSDILSSLRSERMIALTAPLVAQERVLVGYALSPEESSCSEISCEQFLSLREDLYCSVTTPLAVHGLKRIWEYLDDLAPLPVRDTDAQNVRHVRDTKLMAYLLDPDSARTYGHEEEGLTLSHLSHKYLRHDYPHTVADVCESGDLGTLRDILAHDAQLIYLLAEELPRHMNQGLKKLYRDLELPLMVVLDDMRRVGIGFDGIRCAEEMIKMQRSMASLAAEITGGESIDLTSDQEVYIFLTDHGIQLNVRDRAIQGRGIKRPLEDVAHAYPIVRKILEWWDMGRDLGFLRRWAGRNRIHPVWGQTRSATSRIYARSPAVQNISRNLRHLFVPAPGQVLIKADYSQAQMRILAHLSGDEALIRVFNDPEGDVHAETSEWLKLNDRNVAKEINFAICFGMGPVALCTKINSLKQKQGRTDFINLDSAQSYINGFYAQYPKVRDFFGQEWEQLRSLPVKDRVVRSLIGRVRKFERRLTSEAERQFKVTWPQQIEADLIKTAMVRLDRIFNRRGMVARIVMMIHDAFWVECPEEEAEQVRHLMWRMMTTAGKLDVPLEIDLK
jgi:DNA polymerase-1